MSRLPGHAALPGVRATSMPWYHCQLQLRTCVGMWCVRARASIPGHVLPSISESFNAWVPHFGAEGRPQYGGRTTSTTTTCVSVRLCVPMGVRDANDRLRGIGYDESATGVQVTISPVSSKSPA